MPEMEGETRLKVLLVDDEKNIRQTLLASLNRMSCDAVAASDGESALQLLKSQPFDFLLTDFKLGAKSGLDLIRAAHPKHFVQIFPQDYRPSRVMNHGMQLAATDLTLLHDRSEGWVAALQMAALTLRGATDPVQLARALNVHGHTMADYFVEEVLQQQPTPATALGPGRELVRAGGEPPRRQHRDLGQPAHEPVGGPTGRAAHGQVTVDLA